MKKLLCLAFAAVMLISVVACTKEEPKTLGATLYGIFEENVSSAEGSEALANTIIEKAALPFMAGVIPVEEGFLNGFDDGSFKPKANLTRAEAAVVINNYLKYMEGGI